MVVVELFHIGSRAVSSRSAPVEPSFVNSAEELCSFSSKVKPEGKTLSAEQKRQSLKDKPKCGERFAEAKEDSYYQPS